MKCRRLSTAGPSHVEVGVIEHRVEQHHALDHAAGAAGFRKRLSGSPMAAQIGL